MAYKVKLDNFEGPFDLLVYLIENARMSIYDIKVAEITTQYIEYISALEEADVVLSAEFFLLAAELIDLKSKMLLPRFHGTGEEEEAEDPREGLVQRILEYKQFKGISQMLADRELLARRVMEKPQEDISMYIEDPKEELLADDRQFAKAFVAFLTRRKKLHEIYQRYERVERQQITAEERQSFIMGLFAKQATSHLTFSQLVSDKDDRYDIALSFSSLLEMVKDRRLNAEQPKPFKEIDVTVNRQSEGKSQEKEQVKHVAK